MQATCCNDAFPKWTIVGLLPHGTAALYMPNELPTGHIVNQIANSVLAADTFLGYRALEGEVLYITNEEILVDSDDIEQLLADGSYRLVVIHPLSNFKANKEIPDPNTYRDYFALNRLAHRFKVTILVTPEKRTDEVDFALDTLITFMVPATADDSPIYRFKVQARDLPLIRGSATFNPASGTLEVA